MTIRRAALSGGRSNALALARSAPRAGEWWLARSTTGPVVLYGIVRDRFETFRAHAALLRDGAGLPRFVDKEFQAFLCCGWLAGGFARFRCTGCGDDRQVALSGKGRGVRGSCGGRLRLVALIAQAAVITRILRRMRPIVEGVGERRHARPPG